MFIPNGMQEFINTYLLFQRNLYFGDFSQDYDFPFLIKW